MPNQSFRGQSHLQRLASTADRHQTRELLLIIPDLLGWDQMPVTLMLNGHPRTFEGLEPGATLVDLVAALDLKGDQIALELNGEIISRNRWGAALVESGDKLELVHFVGGGC